MNFGSLRYLANLVLAFASISARGGEIYQAVAGFSAGPSNPGRGGLIQHPDGNLYGSVDGPSLYTLVPGLIFKITPAGSVTVVARHANPRTDLTYVAQVRGNSELLLDNDGMIWGTTRNGGAAGSGSIFKFNPVSGHLTEVFDFPSRTDAPAGSGFSPMGGLTADGAGNFWGTTAYSNLASEEGIIYRFSPTSGLLETMASLDLPAFPSSSPTLTADGHGWLWGVSSVSNGSLFKVSIFTGYKLTVVTFSGVATGPDRGRWPMANLKLDDSGQLWGTTTSGGSNAAGTVFRVNPVTGALTTLADFSPPPTGIQNVSAVGAMCADGLGWMWGTTSAGGLSQGSGYYGQGTVFKVNQQTGEFRSIAAFTDASGATPGRNPASELTLTADGKIWGMTSNGGGSNRGTVFRIDPLTDSLTTITELSGADASGPAEPISPLVEDDAGHLWGGAALSSTGYGSLYSVNPSTGVIRQRMAFTGVGGSARGSRPLGSLTRDGQGRFWGTTYSGGTHNFGTVFRFDPATEILTTLADFRGGPDGGASPTAGLTDDGQGNYWGTTAGSGQNFGTIFKVDKNTGTLTHVISMTGGVPTQGVEPGKLEADGQGYLWGTCYQGGVSFSSGTIFKVNIGTGAFTTVQEFGTVSVPKRGRLPRARLTADGQGFLWGTTTENGPAGRGSIYKVNALTGDFQFVADPPGTNTGSLFLDPAGFLWGVSPGTGIFKMSTSTSLIQSLPNFTGLGGRVPGGQYPDQEVMKHTDGHLYGVTPQGGILADGAPAGGGQIYRIRQGPLPVSLPATVHSVRSALLAGSVHSNGRVSMVAFEYGTDPSLAGSTLLPVDAPVQLDEPVGLEIKISGLQVATLYYYRIRASNPDNANVQLGKILSFTTLSGGFIPWIQSHGFTGADLAAHADPDNDGLANLMEYVLGGNPGSRSTGLLPVPVAENGKIIVGFQRSVESLYDPDLQLFFETSADLNEWTSQYRIGRSTAEPDSPVVVAPVNTEFDSVRISLPSNSSLNKFIRLRLTRLSN